MQKKLSMLKQKPKEIVEKRFRKIKIKISQKPEKKQKKGKESKRRRIIKIKKEKKEQKKEEKKKEPGESELKNSNWWT